MPARAEGHDEIALAPGTLVFVPAHQVHACNPLPGLAWSYQMLHVEADWLRQLRGEYAPPSYPAREPVRVLCDATWYQRFCALNDRLFGDDSREDKEAALIEFFGRCDLGEGGAIVDDAAAARLRPLLAALIDSEGPPLALAELARLAGCDRYRLLRHFRALTGLTPHAWQLNQRINRARRLLQGGIALAEVAYRLGFADQSHFQRVFKAHVGLPPGRYRH